MLFVVSMSVGRVITAMTYLPVAEVPAARFCVKLMFCTCPGFFADRDFLRCRAWFPTPFT